METWQGREALILSGGPDKDVTYITRFLAQHPQIKIVCADSGTRHLSEIGQQADLIVGDFDSSQYPNMSCEVIALVPEKDDTDTMHALQVVLDRGCTEVWIACATGGRLDHLLSNLSLCEYAHERGCMCRILDMQNELCLIAQQSVSIAKDNAYPYFSLIPLDEQISGLTITGAKYPLTNAVVKRSQMYTVSNEVTAQQAVITLQSGKAFLIRSHD